MECKGEQEGKEKKHTNSLAILDSHSDNLCLLLFHFYTHVDSLDAPIQFIPAKNLKGPWPMLRKRVPTI